MDMPPVYLDFPWFVLVETRRMVTLGSAARALQVCRATTCSVLTPVSKPGLMMKQLLLFGSQGQAQVA